MSRGWSVAAQIFPHAVWVLVAVAGGLLWTALSFGFCEAYPGEGCGDAELSREWMKVTLGILVFIYAMKLPRIIAHALWMIWARSSTKPRG